MSAATHGWQPIETAPRDGREIILGSVYGFTCAGFWSDTPNYWSDYGWFEESDRAACDATRKPFAPTHWQPLPEPPTAPEHRGGGV
jgi:hypothetical protein